MAIPNIMQTGHSSMMASKAGIATSGHNISQANTAGYSRQRVQQQPSHAGNISQHQVGTGVYISRVERLNDEYLEKQIRQSEKELASFEEKDLILNHLENVFNEMSAEGLNHQLSLFFNSFRRLSEEPENSALRESLREVAQSLMNDFHRSSKAILEIQKNVDQRIQGHVSDVNRLTQELSELNHKIFVLEKTGSQPNDLLDQRDRILKSLSRLLDINVSYDQLGHLNVDLKGSGPLVTGSDHREELSVQLRPLDLGVEDPSFRSLDIVSTGRASSVITNQLSTGQLGALVEVRDQTLAAALDKLDHLAFYLVDAVNAIHVQGVNSFNETGVCFFKPLDRISKAAQEIKFSQAVQDSSQAIAAGLVSQSLGDNRVALAIAELQHVKLMDQGQSSLQESYQAWVGELATTVAHQRSLLQQQQETMIQLNRIREKISGVSIDEETTHLMQFQHAFDASAKVIQVADELLKTVLSLKRD